MKQELFWGRFIFRDNRVNRVYVHHSDVVVVGASESKLSLIFDYFPELMFTSSIIHITYSKSNDDVVLYQMDTV